ncbi:hypothetical protein HDU76_014082 [Blyttiomyces sp. JEL0837]|nr:hypothetical protein HDU76_014082 [Blyttiomyces sp. JEL0837]
MHPAWNNVTTRTRRKHVGQTVSRIAPLSKHLPPLPPTSSTSSHHIQYPYNYNSQASHRTSTTIKPINSLQLDPINASAHAPENPPQQISGAPSITPDNLCIHLYNDSTHTLMIDVSNPPASNGKPTPTIRLSWRPPGLHDAIRKNTQTLSNGSREALVASLEQAAALVSQLNEESALNKPSNTTITSTEQQTADPNLSARSNSDLNLSLTKTKLLDVTFGVRYIITLLSAISEDVTSPAYRLATLRLVIIDERGEEGGIGKLIATALMEERDRNLGQQQTNGGTGGAGANAGVGIGSGYFDLTSTITFKEVYYLQGGILAMKARYPGLCTMVKPSLMSNTSFIAMVKNELNNPGSTTANSDNSTTQQQQQDSSSSSQPSQQQPLSISPIQQYPQQPDILEILQGENDPITDPHLNELLRRRYTIQTAVLSPWTSNSDVLEDPPCPVLYHKSWDGVASLVKGPGILLSRRRELRGTNGHLIGASNAGIYQQQGGGGSNIHASIAKLQGVPTSTANQQSNTLNHPFLFIGSQDSAKPKHLRRYQINHVIRLGRHRWPHPSTPGVAYHDFQIDDTPAARISSVIPSIIGILDSVKTRGERVLVHCQAGVSRSASVVIAYIQRRGVLGSGAIVPRGFKSQLVLGTGHHTTILPSNYSSGNLKSNSFFSGNHHPNPLTAIGTTTTIPPTNPFQFQQHHPQQTLLNLFPLSQQQQQQQPQPNSLQQQFPTLHQHQPLQNTHATLREAYEILHAARPIVCPNPGFWQELEQYERVLNIMAVAGTTSGGVNTIGIGTMGIGGGGVGSGRNSIGSVNMSAVGAGANPGGVITMAPSSSHTAVSSLP